MFLIGRVCPEGIPARCGLVPGKGEFEILGFDGTTFSATNVRRGAVNAFDVPIAGGTIVACLNDSTFRAEYWVVMAEASPAMAEKAAI